LSRADLDGILSQKLDRRFESRRIANLDELRPDADGALALLQEMGDDAGGR
jgi:hypothetical protein